MLIKDNLNNFCAAPTLRLAEDIICLLFVPLSSVGEAELLFVLSSYLFIKGVPALGFEGDFFAVAADEIDTMFGFGYMTDEINIL